VLSAGSVEWMRAATASGTPAQRAGGVRGFQLWVALPPELENAPNASHYVMPEESPVDGPVRVILGSHGEMKSPIDAPAMNYLVVSLKAGERWSYQPPEARRGLVAVHDGVLRTPTPVPGGEIAIFEPSEAPIDFLSEGDTVFVLGSAPAHPATSSRSAATPFTPARGPCARGRRRSAASARASSPKQEELRARRVWVRRVLIQARSSPCIRLEPGVDPGLQATRSGRTDRTPRSISRRAMRAADASLGQLQ